MIIQGGTPHRECDICNGDDKLFQKNYAAVARGATGRWCEVLWLCDTCGDSMSRGVAVTAQQARERVSVGQDWADF